MRIGGTEIYGEVNGMITFPCRLPPGKNTSARTPGGNPDNIEIPGGFVIITSLYFAAVPENRLRNPGHLPSFITFHPDRIGFLPAIIEDPDGIGKRFVLDPHIGNDSQVKVTFYLVGLAVDLPESDFPPFHRDFQDRFDSSS
jgi:hypothetical protein